MVCTYTWSDGAVKKSDTGHTRRHVCDLHCSCLSYITPILNFQIKRNDNKRTEVLLRRAKRVYIIFLNHFYPFLPEEKKWGA